MILCRLIALCINGDSKSTVTNGKISTKRTRRAGIATGRCCGEKYLMSGCIDTMYSGGDSLNMNTVGVRMLMLVSASDQKDSNISMHTVFKGGGFKHCNVS